MIDTRCIIEILPETESEGSDIMGEVFFKFSNPLTSIYRTCNLLSICKYCKEHESELSSTMEANVAKLNAVPAFYNSEKESPNVILRQIKEREKSYLRVTLSPGLKDSMNDLNIPETTHHMVEYISNAGSGNFHPAEKHKNSPIFYQRVNSSDNAELYIEALVVDAVMCHYMGVSDAAQHHDSRQAISQEKVQFIKEIVNGTFMIEINDRTKHLLNYVGNQLTKDTPYISFFSIFSIAPKDCYEGDLARYDAESFGDYCKLWKGFQKWYFHKHGKFFSRTVSVDRSLQYIFDRNKFKGQLSVFDVAKAVDETFKRTEEEDLEGSATGWGNLYAFAILKHVPNSKEKIERLNNIYRGKIHQNIWKIIRRCDYKIFNGLEELVCFVTFLME